MASLRKLAQAAVLAQALSLAAVNAFADTPAVNSLPYSQCFDNAAARYRVNADLLRSIAWHESKFNPKANNTENATPTEDIGVMQINSWWLTNGLDRYGIDRHALWEPCTNIHVGAWILSSEIAKHKDIWVAVGYYNAKTDWKRERYISYIKKALSDLHNGQILSRYKGGGVKLASGTGKRSETLTEIPQEVLVASRVKTRQSTNSRSGTKWTRPEIVVVSEG